MRMNTSIPMMGQQPDIVNVLRQANVAGQERRDFDRTNALRAMLMEQGPGIMAGEQNALAALAQYDPQAALGVQDTRLGMDQTRLNMDLARQQNARQAQESQMRLRVLGRQEAAAIEQEAAQRTAAEREQARRELAITMTALNNAQSPQEWDQIASGLDPSLVGSFQNREMIIAGLQDTDEIIAGLTGGQEGFRPATAEEAAGYGAAGGQFGPDGRFYPINPPSGMSVEVGPDGQMRVTQGAGVGQERPGDPTNISAMIATIDGILADPALDVSTGLLSPLQAIPGTPQRRFGTRAEQLQGQAFLRAYQSLRGSGQITEIEGQKATQAIGRLDTAQSAQDYRDALNELREVLVAAQSRPPGWADTQQAQGEEAPAAPEQIDPASVTPEAVQTMTPQQISAYVESAGGYASVPDDILAAIAARAGGN